jgi:hypothetical protein
VDSAYANTWEIMIIMTKTGRRINLPKLAYGVWRSMDELLDSPKDVMLRYSGLCHWGNDAVSKSSVIS